MTKSVTVQSIAAHEVVVPGRPGAINSPALGNFLSHPWDTMPICLIEVRFSDGLVGLGEVGRGVDLAQLDPWLKSAVGAAPRGFSLAGLPESWRGAGLWGGLLDERYPPALWSSPSPLAGALEMALLDRAGQALGCRAVDLLGGAVRERIPVDYWCGRQTPDDLRATVARARAGGFTGLKMKSRLGDPVLEQVAAIRESGGPGFSVTIDPMYQWLGPLEALHLLKGLEPYADMVRVEDPFPEDQPDFWRRARAVSAVPLVWHARSQASLRRALQERCADGFNVAGSAVEFLTAAHAIETAGYSCWRGSSLELGVAQAAGLHAAAAARACVLPSDFQGALIREHTLTTWDWPYENGSLPLPPGDGLGIELDRDVLRHFQTGTANYQ